jgi:hypothetical protein
MISIPAGYKTTEEYREYVMECQKAAHDKWADNMSKVFTLNHAQTLHDISRKMSSVSIHLYDSLDSEYDYPTLFGPDDIKNNLHSLRQTVTELVSYMTRLDERSNGLY